MRRMRQKTYRSAAAVPWAKEGDEATCHREDPLWTREGSSLSHSCRESADHDGEEKEME